MAAPTIESLRDVVRGQVVEPNDPSYDETRSVYNAMHDAVHGPWSAAWTRPT